jgi:hypothetical protein
MHLRQRFRRAALERGLPDDEVRAFAGFLRFGISAGRVDEGAPAGQRGGLPRLPVDMPWPASPSGPLPFVASLDCAAVPRVDDLALPADGSLLFFLHHDLAHGCRWPSSCPRTSTAGVS